MLKRSGKEWEKDFNFYNKKVQNNTGPGGIICSIEVE